MQAVRQASGDVQGQVAAAPSAGDAAAGRKWLAASEKALGFLQAANPRIVGVTGDRPGAGCTSLARALAKAYGGDGIRVEKAGELPAAIDAAVASSSGLFLLHVLIDPLLKADMAAFIDKAAMNCG